MKKQGDWYKVRIPGIDTKNAYGYVPLHLLTVVDNWLDSRYDPNTIKSKNTRNGFRVGFDVYFTHEEDAILFILTF